MSIVKSFSVGVGDMYYIKHNSDNFSIIDCCLSDENKKDIVNELLVESKGKGITRFVSTHPDEDHIQQLNYLDEKMPIINFYCPQNESTKEEETEGFKKYCELRDSDKAFFVSRNCSRKWMNISDDERGAAGINFLWPKTGNTDYQEELGKVKNGESPNNISPIFTYSLEDGPTLVWMGDLENDFMEKIKNEITLSKINVLFAPHHGRKSGKVVKDWLEQMNPDIIIIGEASSKDLDYASYKAYNTITQNSAGDITFDCFEKKIDIYVSENNYTVDFLDNDNMFDNYNGYYLGSLKL